MVGRANGWRKPQVILGHVRDGLPRLSLTLSGREGPLAVEFVLDTGCDAALVLRGRVLKDLVLERKGEETTFVPGVGIQMVPRYSTMILWEGEWREVDVIHM